ncbi:MAG: FlgD immunoglobulin-like domain containing protein [Candidatus Cloacimonadaceae bacterium]|nr:FlgD immunoglobulin-like domain containing protein [Candidatus Cloacimonadaceae bacterium]
MEDFFIAFMQPVAGVQFDIDNDQLTLSWGEPPEPFVPVQGYKVYRKLNAGRFELMGIYPALSYSENLVQIGTYRYQVTAVYGNFESLPGATISFEFPYTDSDENIAPPIVTKLHQNYPNPFNPSTVISFDLAKSGSVKLNIYNIKGQLVKRLINKDLPLGSHRFFWDGKDENRRGVASGIYFYKMESGRFNQTRKMILLK